MNIEDYKQALVPFSNMGSQSWVATFRHDRVQLGGQEYPVVLPELEDKPCMIIRLVRRIVSFICSFFPCLVFVHNDVVIGLSTLMRTADAVLRQQDSVLLARVVGTARDILQKLPGAHPASETDVSRESSELERRFDQPPRLRSVPLPVTDVLTDMTQTLCEGYKLGSEAFVIGHSVNWENPPADLVDPQYVEGLIAVLKSEANAGLLQEDVGDLHHQCWQDLQFLKDSENYVTFSRFLLELSERQVRSSYEDLLSTANQNTLYQIVCAIMNHLHHQRKESDFSTTYINVVAAMCLLLQHGCSNQLNTGMENIYMSILTPAGPLGTKIRWFLQKERYDILGRTVLSLTNGDQASTVNYYRRILSTRFGISADLCKDDTRYAGVAAKISEQEIADGFCLHYNPSNILQKVWRTIVNPNDPVIPVSLFTEWLLGKYSGLDESTAMCDMGSGEQGFHPKFVLALLVELGILKAQEQV
ncbi:MAG: hypothetical protein A3D96_00235 [Chlamydiae bacterium RIFCSPHIGHO2_12_FULL_44_59]|nr:MAG: hypothetical protein A2796_07380 [Chlamydiae bacterium RIFCSPHIGHO2_01_FULL_44_39]OGN57314.1 MAG: hypothetical protein A3C42_03145 [Chlamydiae bacterium RIFCSPHIGHO2_02_FULL_45_9]OGN60811.1 MAG: hypothetical protein A3D96_00235 [Chlamydiae bacterium RIFCSPHIGHO2_12_FULL_44_59]OGN66687.1 MAG: hypothetical protein A2978_02870 [Chlamydiae bacterium RIFCSPLOWO2_01_FULL_44_52]OGN67337.1 MAG: hypothetical protein A3I67_06065 [Chlamydiae bacterium RIFCSPLOWO2_02_FULL_45_22]OGN70612.1 MAG: hyp